LAGAVRFELTARSFGVDVGKTSAHIQQPDFRAAEPHVNLPTHAPEDFDALLMLRGFFSGTQISEIAPHEPKKDRKAAPQPH